MNIGIKLRNLRIDNDITIEYLSNKFGIDRKTIWRIEKNTFYPKVEVLIKYSVYFNLSLDYICGIIDYPQKLVENSKKPCQ